MPAAKRFRTVNCILRNGDRILILKRSQRVRTNPELWSGVAGRIEDDLSVEETGLREVEEELGINRAEVKLIQKGPEFQIRTLDSEVTVAPILFETRTSAVKLNWEHTDFVWIRPSEISQYQTVPHFNVVLRNLKIL